MKIHFKPLANRLQTAWRKAIILHFTFSILHSTFASVPLAWQVTPRNPAPVTFDRHHGETLEFRCTFSGFGELPFGQAADIRLWYQTNGMGAAWWSVPATVSSNVLAATFPPQADPGADRLALFFGAPSNAYASAVLRLRPSPGFTPNVLPPPDTASFEESDPVFSAWLADGYAIGLATQSEVEQAMGDATSGAILAANAYTDDKISRIPPSGVSSNDVCNIVTNETGETWGVWNFPGISGEEGTVRNPQVIEELTEHGWTYMMAAEGFNYELATYEMIHGSDTYPTRMASVTIPCISFDSGLSYEITATRTVTPSRNALGLARLVDLPPLTNEMPAMAAAAVYDVHDLKWDAEESILYWCKFVGGHDLCIAVTNIDLTHPTNAVLLKAWREANR